MFIVDQEKLGAPYGDDCATHDYIEFSEGETYKHRFSSCYSLYTQQNSLQNCDCIQGGRLSVPSLRKKGRFCNDMRHVNVTDIDEAALGSMFRKKYAYYNKEQQKWLPCTKSHEKNPCLGKCKGQWYDIQLITESKWPDYTYQLAFYESYIKGKLNSSEFNTLEDLYQRYSTNTMKWGELVKHLKDENAIRENFIKVKIDFRRTSTKKKEIAFVTIEKLFGNMGGVLNLWVGISFITVIEVLELIWKYLWFSERKDRKDRFEIKAENPSKQTSIKSVSNENGYV